MTDYHQGRHDFMRGLLFDDNRSEDWQRGWLSMQNEDAELCEIADRSI